MSYDFHIPFFKKSSNTLINDNKIDVIFILYFMVTI